MALSGLQHRSIALFLALSLIFPPIPRLAFAPEPVAEEAIPAPAFPPVPATTESAPAGSFTRAVARALGRGATLARIYLVASDDEMRDIRTAIEEGEHAVEPPMEHEGFWRRKWELIRHPLVALDLRRSFQNVRRVLRLSRDFDSPWIRELMLSSATMFAITHGGEFATGLVMGTYELFSWNFAAALGWYGLALPGLYDVGCWIGQGSLLIRPTRAAFNFARRTTVAMAGRAVEKLGLAAAARALFEHTTARRRIVEAVGRAGEGPAYLEIEIPDEELMRLHVRDATGATAAVLHFEPNRYEEMTLTRADLNLGILAKMPPRELSRALKSLGWNVKGALRQMHKLIRRQQRHLIQEEKTFVTRVEEDNGWLRVSLRGNAVAVASRNAFVPMKRLVAGCKWLLGGRTTPPPGTPDGESRAEGQPAEP